MKRILLLLPLFLLVLVGCKVEVNANMYEIKDWVYPEEITDYQYEILDTYDDYQQTPNYHFLNTYEKEYFVTHTVIIIYLRDSTTGNRYALREVIKNNSKLIINIEYIEHGLDQAFSTTVYCVEVETKGIKKVEVKRMNNE